MAGRACTTSVPTGSRSSARWRRTCSSMPGTSGHGFKLAPALGKHVADLVSGSSDLDPRLEEFDPVPIHAGKRARGRLPGRPDPRLTDRQLYGRRAVAYRRNGAPARAVADRPPIGPGAPGATRRAVRRSDAGTDRGNTSARSGHARRREVPSTRGARRPGVRACKVGPSCRGIAPASTIVRSAPAVGPRDSASPRRTISSARRCDVARSQFWTEPSSGWCSRRLQSRRNVSWTMSCAWERPTRCAMSATVSGAWRLNSRLRLARHRSIRLYRRSSRGRGGHRIAHRARGWTCIGGPVPPGRLPTECRAARIWRPGSTTERDQELKPVGKPSQGCAESQWPRSFHSCLAHSRFRVSASGIIIRSGRWGRADPRARGPDRP